MQPETKLEITLNSDGSITIAGPINNKILSYGILESARKALDDYVPSQKPDLVIVPRITFNGN